MYSFKIFPGVTPQTLASSSGEGGQKGEREGKGRRRMRKEKMGEWRGKGRRMGIAHPLFSA